MSANQLAVGRIVEKSYDANHIKECTEGIHRNKKDDLYSRKLKILLFVENVASKYEELFPLVKSA